MYKANLRRTTVFTLVHQADLVLTSHTADALHQLLRRWPGREELKKALIENGIMAVVGLSAGALFALVTTFLL